MPVHSPDEPTPFAALPAKVSKWSATFWEDLLERVGATAIGALVTALVGDWSGVIPSDPRVWWTVVGLPTLLSLLKGLMANLANPESGPSLLPSPPAPKIPEAPQD